MAGRQMVDVLIERLANGTGLELPAYQSAGAAGFDISAAVGEGAAMRLAPGERVLVPTGFAVAVPDGFELQVRPRSGLAMRHGVTVLNAPGTVDSDYRGEVKVLLVNLGVEDFVICRGERIAQGVVAAVAVARFRETDTLPATVRAAGGFGSTGR